MSRLSAFSNPAFGLTDSAARTGCRALGPPAPRPPPAEPSRRWLVLSNPADLPLRAASAPDTVEVLLEMGVTKRLQENAPEREKPRERTVSQGV